MIDWNGSLDGFSHRVSGSDSYSLSIRASRAIECNAILAEKPEWDCRPQRLKLQGHYYDEGGIEQKVDHINTILWKGDVNVQSVGLPSAWKSCCILVEQDLDLSAYYPADVFKAMGIKTNVDLLNPFGTNILDDKEDEMQNLDITHAPH